MAAPLWQGHSSPDASGR